MDESSETIIFFPGLQKHISCQYPGLTKYFKDYDRNLNTKFENPSKYINGYQICIQNYKMYKI